MRLKLHIATFLFLCTPLLTSCSKDSSSSNEGARKESASAKANLEQSLLSKAPASTYGFFAIVDQTSEAGRKLRGSPWGMPWKIEAAAEEKEGSPTLSKLSQDFATAGLLPTSPDQPVAFKDMVWFVGGDLVKSPEVGLFGSAAGGIDLQGKITILKDLLAKDGFQPRAESVPNAPTAFSVPVTIQNNKTGISRIFVAATKDRLAATTSSAATARVFDPSIKDGASTLLGSADLKAAQSRASIGDQIGYGFLDVKAGLAEVMKVLPDEEKAKNPDLLTSIPVRSVYATSSMSDGLRTQAFAFTDPSEKTGTFLSAMTQAQSANVLAKTPPGVVLLLSLDGKLLQGLKDAAIQSLPPESQSQLKTSPLRMLDSLKALGVGVRNNPTQPFPDFVLVADSSDSVKLESELRSALAASTSGGKLPMSPWQEKDLSGAKVRFTLTPFGLGIFLGESKGTVIITSSEPAMQEVISSVSDSNKTIAASMSSPTRKLFEEKKGPIMYYANLSQMASLIESVQGSLAMFTGGKTSVTKEQIDKIRKMGQLAGVVSFHKEVIEATQEYSAP